MVSRRLAFHRVVEHYVRQRTKEKDLDIGFALKRRWLGVYTLSRPRDK